MERNFTNWFNFLQGEVILKFENMDAYTEVMGWLQENTCCRWYSNKKPLECPVIKYVDFPIYVVNIKGDTKHGGLSWSDSKNFLMDTLGINTITIFK